MDKVKIFKIILHKYNDFLIFYLTIFITEFILRINTNLDLSKKAIVINIILLSILSSILVNFSKKIRKIFEFVIAFFIVVYSFAQNYHFYFFGTFFSFTKLTIVNELGGVFDELIVKFNPRLLLFLIPLIINIAYLVIDKNENKYRFNVIRLLISLLLAVVLVFIYSKLFYLPDDIAWDYNTTSDEYLYQNMTNKLQFMNRFGTLSFIERDIRIITSKNSSKLTNEQKNSISDYINSLNHDKNKYTGIFKGKNVVLVLAESLAPYGIDEKLTPTLYKMCKDGFYFDNFYSPLYPSNTADSEFIALTSLMPSLYSGTTSKSFDKNYYPYSLPKLFANNGYKSNSYHSFIKNFYNRESMHNALGLNFFYDREDLKLSRWDGFHDEINWIDDIDLFEATINNTDLSSRFFDFVITGSGHMPYNDMREELFNNVQKVKEIYPNLPSDIVYYLAAQMKLDEGLSKLITTLKDNNILDDTVIIVFGDHYPYGANEKIFTEYYLKDRPEYEKFKTPFIIYNSNTNGEQIHTLSSTFDIVPTIANMFELDLSNAFIIGNDIMSNHTPKVIFGDGNILTDSFYYQTNGSDVKLFNNNHNYNDTISKINKLIDLSQVVLTSDYYRKTK